jgi:hypothetical protein
VFVSTAARAVALPPSTWVALSPLSKSNDGTIFGLAVNPTNTAQLVAGDSSGRLYRSNDSGSSWTSVYAGKSSILTVAYDALSPHIVIAGTLGGGVLVSKDAGSTWAVASGTGGRTVRALAFAHSLMVAATDHGVYASNEGSTWTSSGLASVSLDAVAVEAVNDPVRIVVGGDSASGAIPMYQSVDAGATWTQMTPGISGTVVTRLTTGPVAPKSGVRRLVVGTNTGLFISADDGVTFTALSGAQLLPSVDYTQVGFTSAHFDRFYAASDGGGGGAGGLWATADSGQHFSSLQPPVQSITALAVSSDEQPVLYVATFRASDHAAMLWGYRDTGGTPEGPFIFVSPTATAARTNGSAASILDFLRSVASSQVPYIALGVIAIGLILLAAVSQFRSRRR